jgi:hypothetical protein
MSINAPDKPSRHWLLRLIESNRNWIGMLAVAGIFGFCATLFGIARSRRPISALEVAGFLIAMPASLMLAVAWFCRADVVRGRLDAGEKVGPWSRLLFAAGVWSIAIWVLLALLIGTPLAVWLGKLI